MTNLSGFYRLGLALSLVLGITAQSARAGNIEIDMTVSQGVNSATFNIFLGSGEEDAGSTSNNVSGNLALINGFLASSGIGVTFASLGANSNNPGNVFSGITQNGLFSVAAGGAPVSITSVAFQTDFLSPVGGVGSLQSSSSSTFANTAAGSSQMFQSWFDQTNTGAMSTPSPNLNFTYGNLANSLDSQSGTATPTTVLNVAPPYALVNQISLSIGTTNQPTANSFGGATILLVTAVPEPASVMMMASALPIAFGLIRRYRRGVKITS
jgi:hypothetical protein